MASAWLDCTLRISPGGVYHFSLSLSDSYVSYKSCRARRRLQESTDTDHIVSSNNRQITKQQSTQHAARLSVAHFPTGQFPVHTFPSHKHISPFNVGKCTLRKIALRLTKYLCPYAKIDFLIRSM